MVGGGAQSSLIGQMVSRSGQTVIAIGKIVRGGPQSSSTGHMVFNSGHSVAEKGLIVGCKSACERLQVTRQQIVRDSVINKGFFIFMPPSINHDAGYKIHDA